MSRKGGGNSYQGFIKMGICEWSHHRASALKVRMKVSSIGFVTFYYPFQHVLNPSLGNRTYSQNILICSDCMVGSRCISSMLFISLFTHWSKQHWSTAETFLMHVVIRLREPRWSWEDLLPTAVTGGYMGTKCVDLKSLGLNLVLIFISQSIQLFMFNSFGVILKLCGRAKEQNKPKLIWSIRPQQTGTKLLSFVINHV